MVVRRPRVRGLPSVAVAAIAELAALTPRPVTGQLQGAAVLPHGDFALAPALLHGIAGAAQSQEAEDLHRGSAAAGDFVAALNAEVLVLTTPHGVANFEEVAVFGNSALSGPDVLGRDVNASFGEGSFGRGIDVALSARGDPSLARAVYGNLSSAGVPATLLNAWGDAVAMPLKWGELFPLRYISRGPELKGPAVVVLSLPEARHTRSGQLMGRLRRAGQIVGQTLSSIGKRFAVVVSTDLSHRHWVNSSFGAHPLAEPFDEGCGRYASTLDYSVLEGQAAFVDEVFSCGWLGLPFLHGVLDVSGEALWEGEVTAQPVAPTYYGMMASIVRRGRAKPQTEVIV